jgi:hypothetical protein
MDRTDAPRTVLPTTARRAISYFDAVSPWTILLPPKSRVQINITYLGGCKETRSQELSLGVNYGENWASTISPTIIVDLLLRPSFLLASAS